MLLSFYINDLWRFPFVDCLPLLLLGPAVFWLRVWFIGILPFLCLSGSILSAFLHCHIILRIIKTCML